jgi:hypothetical protein
MNKFHFRESMQMFGSQSASSTFVLVREAVTCIICGVGTVVSPFSVGRDPDGFRNEEMYL